MTRSALLVLVTLFAASAAPAAGQRAQRVDSALLGTLRWRPIGPANMGGRVTDVEGIPSPSRTFFVAAAAGGIWKTTNAGTTFRPVFDRERVASMGDLAIAPSDTLQVWAGTGEEDSRNSISPGGGIYKSTDGGLTWKLMGLEQTEHIGRIIVHPTNPDIVWVAAVGAAWRANPERGLYRTTDGGATWRLVKFIGDRAGFVDIALDPRDPDVLFAASWERVRGPYFLKSGGPGSALWKSTDGGESWTVVKGGGFPETELGRIGLAIAPGQPDVMYALVEAAENDGRRQSGLYRSEDAGRTWTHMNTNNVRPFYYSQVRVDPVDPNRVYWSSTPVNWSNDGGRSVGTTTLGIHVDHHAMWIDPNDPNHIVVGNDGGIAVSWDRGGNWDFVNTMPLGQFYAISHDMAVPYRVCGGLQDNGTWCGPSRRAAGSITNAMWFNVGGGDGFYTAQDPTDPNVIYFESQGGNMQRRNYATNESVRLRKPGWQDAWRVFEDSIVVEMGDESRTLTPEQERRIAAWRARQAADSADLDLRWNWNTPFLLSPHDPRVFYAAANRVLRSTNRGEDLQPISPDLTTRDTMRIRISTRETGGITPDITGAEMYSTIVALAESPLRRGMLFAGTDDGNVWVSPDEGATWTELTGRFPEVPPKTYVSRIEPSSHDAERYYVTFDNHREGDFTPYVFVTEDGGRSFRSIADGLPTGGPDFVHVIREDPVNPDLLFVGTDVGVHISLDRGTSWRKFMRDLPTVPVHDLKIHPRDRELIAGTHGRSIWIVDIAPLQQLRPALIAEDAVLFEPPPAFQFGSPPVGGEAAGQRFFEAPGGVSGTALTYFIATGDALALRRAAGRDGEAAAAGPGGPGGATADIVILDAAGDTVQTLTGPIGPGVHTVTWNLRRRPDPGPPLSPSERRDSVRQDERIAFLADSLVNAGADSAVVQRAVSSFRSGNFRGFGFGGGGGMMFGSGFIERPGESAAMPPTAGGDEQEITRNIFRLLRGQGGGFAFREPPPLAEPGEYTVRLELPGRALTTRLRVERGPEFDDANR